MSEPAVSRLTVRDFDRSVPQLADVLVELVEGGVSLGFLRPLGRAAAESWWRGRRDAVAEGALTVWVAAEAGRVLGTVGLARAPMPAGRHRAEVVKLMVRPGAQGRGLGRALLATAERAARAAGLRLLLLDTEADTPAERLYRAAGWTHYGTVPEYAAESGGALRDCSFFYKRLDDGPLAGGRPDYGRPDDERLADVRPDDGPLAGGRLDDVRLDDVRLAGGRPDHVRPDDGPLAGGRPDHGPLAGGRPDYGPSEAAPAGARSARPPSRSGS